MKRSAERNLCFILQALALVNNVLGLLNQKHKKGNISRIAAMISSCIIDGLLFPLNLESNTLVRQESQSW